MRLKARVYQDTDGDWIAVPVRLDTRPDWIGCGADEAEAIMDLKMKIAGEAFETVYVTALRR